MVMSPAAWGACHVQSFQSRNHCPSHGRAEGRLTRARTLQCSARIGAHRAHHGELDACNTSCAAVFSEHSAEKRSHPPAGRSAPGTSRSQGGASVRGYMILWNLAGAERSELTNRFRMALAAALPALRAAASDPSDVELASISRPSSSNTCQFQRQPPAESAQGRTLTSKKRYGSTPSIWDACQPFVRAACGPFGRGGAGRRA